MTNAVDFNQVSFSYGNNCVLQNTSFHIPSKSISVLFGPSGSGKTTCLRLIAGLETPQTGTIKLSGNDSSLIPLKNRQVGFCFQEPALWNAVSVQDHIRLCIKDENRVEEKTQEYIKQYHLDHLYHRYPHQLSGGEKKRLDFARAIASKPKILLLDEPLSSVEEPLRNELIQTIETCRNLGGSVIAVTHQKDEMYALAEHLVILHNGEVMNEGTPQTVYHSPQNTKTATLLGLTNIFKVEIHKGKTQTPFGIVTTPENQSGHWLAGCAEQDLCVTVNETGNAAIQSCSFVSGKYSISFTIDNNKYQGWSNTKAETGQHASVELKRTPLLIEPLNKENP